MSHSNSLEFKLIWETRGPGKHLLEGPAYSPDKNLVFFTDLFQRKIYSFTPTDPRPEPKCVFIFEENFCNGMQIDSNGNLVVCLWGGLPFPQGSVGELQFTDNGTLELHPRVSTGDGNRKLQHPNDLGIDEEGGIYFSDLRAGTVYYHPQNAPHAVSCFSKRFSKPNGIEIGWRDGRAQILYVAESGRSKVRKFEIVSPGKIGNELSCHSFKCCRAVDGLALAPDGNLYVAEEKQVIGLSPDFKEIAHGSLGRKITPSNICFVDSQTLVVTSYRSYFFPRKAELFIGKVPTQPPRP